MSELMRPLKSGYAPDAKQLEDIRKKYQAKTGYFVFTILCLTLLLLGILLYYSLGDHQETLFGYPLDQTIAKYYVIALFVVFLGISMRASFCMICGKYRWPNHMDLNGYCDHCGAHLFKFEVYQKQKEERSKHDLPLDERLVEMVKRGDEDAIRMLIFKGAKVNAQDRFGNTVLINATMTGKPEIVKLLLDYKADVTIINNFGMNALMIAVDKRFLEIAKLLLETGVSIHKVSKDGRSSVDIANENNDQEMLDLLHDYEI